MKRLTICAALTAVVMAMAPVSALAEGKAAAFTDDQKQEMGKIIHDYLMANPRVIMDAVDQYRQNQETIEAQAFAAKIKERHNEIYNDPEAPVVGNPKGDVTLVEFFDYNCGYCKQAFRDVQKLIEEDKNLRVVFKELPILSETSRVASRYALAAGKQGKYWEFHTALMTQSGPLNEARLETLAKDIGLDLEKLKVDADSEGVRGEIEKNLELSREIGINGTPGFVIDDEAVRGHFGLEALRQRIVDSRTKDKSE